MTRILLMALCGALLSGLTTRSSQATVINITYRASVIHTIATSEAGVGSVTFAPNALTTIGLLNVTGFSFTLTEGGPLGPSITTYGLANLATFSAALDGAGGVTALSLTMPAFSSGTGGGVYASQGLAFNLPTGTTVNGDVGVISSGAITASVQAVPEPVSLAILGLGLTGAGIVRRRRS